jgi:RimJ/RimL family protein N-acetyltransferase
MARRRCRFRQATRWLAKNAEITILWIMITGTNVILRTVKESDLEELFQLESDVGQRTALSPVPFTSFVDYKRDYEKFGWWFEDGGGLVITTLDGSLIGTIGCRKNGIIAGYEVGYQILRQEHRGNGYMSEALPLFTRHMFDWKEIPRLYLLIQPQNAPSIALAKSAGYVYEGLLRSAVFVRGEYRDLAIYGILREEA